MARRSPTLRLAALVVLAGTVPATFAAGAPTVGEAAPPLRVTTFAGAPFDLNDHRGHVVVVHFWASWCVPCREEMPELEAFYREHRLQGTDVIAVSVDHGRDLRDARRAAARFDFPAAAFDAAAENGWASPAALPMTFVLDAAGRVRDVLVPGQRKLTAAGLAERVREFEADARPSAGAP